MIQVYALDLFPGDTIVSASGTLPITTENVARMRVWGHRQVWIVPAPIPFEDELYSF